MSKVIPFEALLPNPELVSRIICPPYDVISSKNARLTASDNPCSFLHISKPEIDLPTGADPYSEAVYEMAAQNIDKFMKDGYLYWAEPGMYVYRLKCSGGIQTGVVCAASVDEYENGLIKKHERVRDEKVRDRTNHSVAAKCHAEPVFLVHEANAKIKALLDSETKKEPLFSAEFDETTHTLWQIADAEAMQNAFEKIDSLYIADGHHRSAASVNVRNAFREKNPSHNGSEPYNFFLTTIFPHDEVRIYEYNWSGDPKDRPLSKYSMADIINISDRNEILPPKSTWFAPKLASGLFAQLL